MQLVSTVTVGAGGAASIEFTSIPQTGTDLLVVLSARNNASGNGIIFRINGDTGSNYAYRRLGGTGSSVYSDGFTDPFGLFGNAAPSTSTANTFSNVGVYFPNYAGSAAKTYSADSVAENNATAAPQEIIAGRWTGTAAITSLNIYISGSSFVQHTTASLYTITKA
jgi:hypothetical protein